MWKPNIFRAAVIAKAAAIQPRIFLSVGSRSDCIMVSHMSWLSERTSNGPPSAKPRVNGLARDADDLSPFGHAKRLSAVHQNDILTRVSGLLFPRSPSAIAGLVVAVIVYSVERHPVWRVAHVRNKILNFMPAFADIYAAPTVTREARMVRVQAAIPHRVPNLVDAVADLSVLR